MSRPVVIDMNLSAEWVPLLANAGWSAVHWSAIGDPKAIDAVIMAWAVAHKYIVLTHDLDFGTLLALSHAAGPSVVLLRGQRVLPEQSGAIVIASLKQYESELVAGALIVIDEARLRVRILPL